MANIYLFVKAIIFTPILLSFIHLLNHPMLDFSDSEHLHQPFVP